MSVSSPGQGAVATQKRLVDLIDHTFLLPDAGRGDDSMYDDGDFRADMIRGLQSSLEAFETHVVGPALAAISRCRKLLDRLQQAKPGAGQLHAQTVQELLLSLSDNETIAFDICAQNAAVLITKKDQAFAIEPFELLAPNAWVMSCQGSLIRQFPDSAIIIPADLSADAHFLATFADLLAQLDTQTLPEFSAKARKGGQEHVEERDTTNPALVTDMLRSWLRGYDIRTAPNVRIQKRSREHVRYNTGHKIAWHRSPLWLFLRVVLRLILDRDDHPVNPAISTYKSFMIFHMSSILDRATSGGLSSEHLYCISAKISRRVHKLGLEDEPAWLVDVNRPITTATHCLQRRWKQTQERDSLVLDLSRHEALEIAASTQFEMAEFKGHVAWLKTRASEPIAPSDLAQRHDIPRHAHESLPHVSTFDSIWELLEFETWVAEHLSLWTDKKCRDSSNNFASLVIEFAPLIETYHTKARTIYSNNPENLSRAYLVALELWVACDKLATTSFPIIKEFQPGILDDAFGKLLLPKLEEMERLRAVEIHLGQRISQAQYPTSPCSGVFGQRRSFACRVFNASPEMQGLLDEAKTTQADGRRRKQEEFQRLKSEYSTLIADAAQLSHQQYRHKKGQRWETSCKSNCTKCQKSRAACNMQISVWEDILPDGFEKTCQSMIAELEMDPVVQGWRNVTLLLTEEIFVQATPKPITSQVFWLRSHNRLPTGSGKTDLSQCRFQPGSTTKPFDKAHYRSIKVSAATLDNVCKPHGCDYSYKDYRLGADIKTGIGCLTVPPSCSLAALSSLPHQGNVNLRDFIRGTTHTSNDVLAGQHACPEEMSLEEFRAFGCLRSDLRLQWHNVLMELTSPSLNLQSPETALLLAQAAYEAGPQDQHAGDETRLARLRVTHGILDSEKFATAVLDGLQATLKMASETWEASNTCFSLLCLTQRVLTASHSTSVQKHCLEILAGVRSTTFRWASILFEKVDKSDSSRERRDFGSLALVFALICHDTFDVGIENLATIFQDCDTAKLLLITSAFAEQNKKLASSKKNVLMRILHQRQQRLAHVLQDFLSEEIFDHQNHCLDAAAAHFWPAFTPGQSWASAFPGSASRHVLQTMSAASADKKAVAVSFNLLTGMILINGLPVSVLPDQYQSNKAFEIIFGEYIPRVAPSNIPGMHFSGSQTHQGWDVHFALYDNSLSIRTLRNGQRYEFIPANKLGPEVPAVFKHNFYHWLDLDKNTVEFRPLSSCWMPADTDWTLDLEKGTVVQGRRHLLSATSATANFISSSLRALENPKYMSFVLCGLTVKAELPRLQLSFSLHASSGRLHSDNFAGFILDPDQSLGTLIGLGTRLVLRTEIPDSRPLKRTNDVHRGSTDAKEGVTELPLRQRMVLVPRGSVEVNITDVTIVSPSLSTISGKAVPLKQGSVKYAKYTVDEHLHKLRDNGLLGDRLLLAYLHAVTSSCLPDPFTERTGTEEALRLLSSAAVKSHPVIDAESNKLLRLIAELSPQRSYYPRHIKTMEMVSWNKKLPILSQHDFFSRLVTSIEDHAAINVSLGYASSGTRYHDMSDPTLTQRALVRTSFLRTTGFGAEESEKAHDEHYTCRAKAEKNRCQRSAGITRIVVNREARLVEQVSSYSVNDVRMIAGKTILGMGTGDFEVRDLLSLKLHVPFKDFINQQWCRFHRYLSTRIDFPRDKHALSAVLAVYAFTSEDRVSWQAIQALAAFITTPELTARVIFPVDVSQFDLEASTDINNLTRVIADKHRLSLESTPDARLMRMASEDDYAFEDRQAREYDTHSRIALRNLASAMRRQWDQNKCRSPTLDAQASYWDYINLAAFRRQVGECFEMPWRKYEFGVYMGKIEDIIKALPQASPINLEHAAPSVVLCGQPRASHRGFVVFDDLLTHEPPQFEAPVQEFGLVVSINTSMAATPSSALPKTDAMRKLLDDLGAHASGKHESLYLEELRVSADAMSVAQKFSETHEEILKFYYFSSRERHLHETTSYLVSCETAVRAVLEKTLPYTRSSKLSGHWPRVSALLLLQQLSKDRWPEIPEVWRRCLVQYALAVTAVHRAHRMLAAKSWLDLKRDIENKGHANWDPMKHPETLLLEVEGGLLVRPVQEDIARTIRNPPGNLNSVMQLNMGEGKSSVIVPITAVALSDKSKLVRIVVGKPQSNQMMHMLISKLGDLLNRRVFYLPFSRDLQPSIDLVLSIRKMLELCMSEGGMLLLQPEHILSFKLMGIENMHSGDKTLGEALITTQKWLEEHARDIVDESDENFSCKFELVYTMGDQQAVNLGAHRWRLIQRILGLVWDVSLNIHRSDPDGCRIEASQSNTVPVVRIVGDAAGKLLVCEIARRICETGLEGFPIHRQPPSLQAKLMTYMTEPEVPSDVREAVEDPNNKFFCDTTKDTLWLLRGLLAGGVILFSLGEKRWRVNYGRTWTREPATPLAVPYHAKDQPSLRSEFSHPDIIIVLTCLTYYYQGLTNNELDMSFDRLDRKDQVEFDLWVKGALGFDTNLKQLSAINLKDRKQCLEKVYPKLRFSKAAIDFYLSRVVFAKHMREFPKKLSASGWDLARPVDHPVTGFSGTCDSKYVLPLTIKHLELPAQLHTNASVLRRLLRPENHVQELKEGSDSQTFLDTLIKSVLNSEGDSIQVILDVGAQVLQYSNIQASKRWLDATPDTKHEAVIFVNDNDELTVLTRNGRTESLLSSPYLHQTEKCLVFLDEAHTRGIDLKLPETYRAAVTLGPRLSKDRLMQACMRMRKLGAGQSVTFFVQTEIQQHIRRVCGHSPGKPLETADILIWSISETWAELRRSFPLWATQGIRHQRQEPIWSGCLNRLGFEDKDGRLQRQIERYLDDEAQTLEQRYRPQPPLPRNRLLEIPELNDPNFATRRTELQAIQQKCRDHEVRALDSATLQEEQERELSPELECEKHTERPPQAKAAIHTISDVVKSFICTGHLVHTPEYDAVLPAFEAFKHTTAAKLFNVGTFPCNVFVSQDFIRTVVARQEHVSDMFQRPVRWVVTSRTDAGSTEQPIVLVLSSFEVDALYDHLKQSKAVVTHQYAPRMNLAFPNLDHLKLYTMPNLSGHWSIPDSLVAQLNIFAGQPWIKSYAQYVEICKYLGLSYKANKGEGMVAADGFEGKTVGNQACKFDESPVPFLKAIYNGVRNDAQDISRTDIGRVLGGELLRPEDFEDRVEEDRVEEDRVEEDRVEEDRVEEDRVEEDRVEEDRVEEDRVEED